MLFRAWLQTNNRVNLVQVCSLNIEQSRLLQFLFRWSRGRRGNVSVVLPLAKNQGDHCDILDYASCLTHRVIIDAWMGFPVHGLSKFSELISGRFCAKVQLFFFQVNRSHNCKATSSLKLHFMQNSLKSQISKLFDHSKTVVPVQLFPHRSQTQVIADKQSVTSKIITIPVLP